jgi:thymidylate kinase
VTFTLRKGAGWLSDLPAGGEVDIWLPPETIAQADEVLMGAGFRRLGAPGAGRHRFYLAFENGRWLKIDAKIGNPSPATAPAGPPAATLWGRALADRLSGALRQRRPLSLRRLGPVVALLGPDGAGKGSILAALQSEIPIAVRVAYLGWRPRGRPQGRPEAAVDAPRSVSTFRECAFVLYQAARAWRRLVPGYLAAWRGDIVLLDRHPIEVLAIRPRRSPAAQKLERIVFSWLIPRPDVIVVLDAPGAALFARKGEQTPALLEEWRQRYLEVLVPRGAVVVSTEGPISGSVAAVSEVVFRALAARRGW